MVGIVLEGEAAVLERQRLLEDGKEISVTLKERDSQGRKKTSRFQFGVGGDVGWVFYQVDEGGIEPRMILEEVLVHEVAELFQGHIERMELRRGLVDPSPLSPAFAEISPRLDHFVADLDAEFGIEIALS